MTSLRRTACSAGCATNTVSAAAALRVWMGGIKLTNTGAFRKPRSERLFDTADRRTFHLKRKNSR
jgi:hypothetical protein